MLHRVLSVLKIDKEFEVCKKPKNLYIHIGHPYDINFLLAPTPYNGITIANKLGGGAY